MASLISLGQAKLPAWHSWNRWNPGRSQCGDLDPRLLIKDALRRIRFAAGCELIHFSLLLCPLEATQPVKVELVDHGASRSWSG